MFCRIVEVVAARLEPPGRAASIMTACAELRNLQSDSPPDLLIKQLFEKTGSWPKAVEYYHSATPELGRRGGKESSRYGCRSVRKGVASDSDSVRPPTTANSTAAVG